MPIWLRKFTFHKIQEYHNQANGDKNEDNVTKSIAAMKSAGSVSKNSPPKTISPSTYITKASKK
jgi:hypothetical protein